MAGMLSGCTVYGVALMSLAFPPIPVPESEMTTEFPEGYSLGPKVQEDLSDLVQEAIASGESPVYFADRVSWTGMRRFETHYKPKNAAIAAITDSRLLFIWWSEADKSYQALIEMPYEEVYSVKFRASGVRKSINLCHENHPTFLGEESIFFGNETELYVLKSTDWRDNEKTEEVYRLLDRLINQSRKAPKLQSPCD
jgi:hypothetical protein